MGIKPGDRVLEVGVGTGINLALYPREATVTGIDFTASMLEKARERAARKDAAPVRLLQMDAADLNSRTTPSTSSTRRTSSAWCPTRSRSRRRCAGSAGPAAASSS